MMLLYCLWYDYPAKQKIFFLENDPSIREAVTMLLQTENFSVDVCNIETYKEEIVLFSPDVVILGIPYKSYEKETKKIIASIKQQTHRNTPILLISTDEKVGRIVKRIGGNDFLEEPFSIEDLFSKLTHLSAM